MTRAGRLWLVVMALGVAPAGAAELADLVPARNGAAACWSRVYDAAHLQAHPDQQVEALGFAISYAGETAEYAPQYSFSIEARMRDANAGFNTGPCYESDGQIMCGVECDGGYVIVEPRGDGSILLDLETSGFIWMSGGCGTGEEDSGFALESGKDDKQFLLRPMPAKACKSAALLD